MLVKSLGAVFIIGSSLLLYHMYSENLRKRLQSISALCELVEYIKTEIHMYKRPLGDIFSEYNKRRSDKEIRINEREVGIYSAIEGDGYLYGEEERKILRYFDEKIGHGTAMEMTELCEITLRKLRRIEEELKNELPKKQKVYKVVFFLAGLSVVIVLI